MGEIRDDPVALRSPFKVRFFTDVMRRQMYGNFRAVRLLKPGLPNLPPDAPLVVYLNHPGWWDPAFFIVLRAALLPDHEGYAPMENAALERYGFMKRIGVFGVDPGSPAGAVRFIRIGQHLLSNPKRSLWLTPQGRFADPRERPVTLQAGLAHLMARVPGAVALPLAMEYPFWSEKRPEALAAFGTPLRNVTADVDGWQTALTGGLETIQDHLAQAAIARDTVAFETILGGARGVGGIYGTWCRLRDLATGRRHNPDHLTES
ncbi:MAG: lysophospholipid acyltransferase family protein [Pseudomonadota bacterium]